MAEWENYDVSDGASLPKLLGICFLRGAPEDVVVEIGEGEKGGYV